MKSFHSVLCLSEAKGMDIIMKKVHYYYKRMFYYIAGLLIMSAGSNLFLQAALGVAPSCTLVLALTELFPSRSYALFNFIVNAGLLVCETAVEKRAGKKQVLQLLLTFLYSMFIQVTSLPFQMLSTHLMAVRILLSIAACAVLAIGISFTVSSGFAVLPMEGFVASLAEKEGKSFGTVRVRIETLITVISAVISILFLGNISAVGIGTVIAAVCTGNITNWFTHLFGRRLRFC